MQTETAKCKDRVADEMQSREAQIREMQLKAEESGYYGDEEAIYELALGITNQCVMKICLSTGGPADYLEILHDGDGIISVTYRFSDWYDTATREVQPGSALWNYAQMMYETF